MITLDLKALENIFQQDGFQTQMLAAEEVPEGAGELLLLALNNQESAWKWHLELMFLPEMDKPVLLQLFAILPVQPVAQQYGDLSRFLMKMNNYLPLPGFGLSEKDGWIFFRYLLACPPEGAESKLLVNTVWTAAYQIDRYGPLMVGVAAGEQTFEQAAAALDEALQG